MLVKNYCRRVLGWGRRWVSGQDHFGQVEKVMEVNRMTKINCQKDLGGHQQEIQQDHIYNGKFIHEIRVNYYGLSRN